MPVEITNRTAPPQQSVPNAIDSLFVPMKTTSSGLPTDKPIRCRSLADYVAAGGTRQMNTAVYDGLDAFFKEGGHQAYASGVVS